MKQRVAHGTMIEVATPDEVHDIVTRATAKVNEQRYPKKGIVNLDATGFGSDKFVVPAQYDWLLERITIAGAPSALVTIYENDPNSLMCLLEIIQLGTAGLYSDGFANNLWIPANNQVFVQVSGGPANGQLGYRIQVRQEQHTK